MANEKQTRKESQKQIERLHTQNILALAKVFETFAANPSLYYTKPTRTR